MTSTHIASSIVLVMLGIKAGIIWRTASMPACYRFLPFFIPLAFMNVIELSFYFYSTQSMLGLRLYYFLALVTIFGAIIESLGISEKTYIVGYLYAVIALLCSILFLFTNKLIQGYVPFLLTITAIKGNLYFIWQATALIGLATIVTILASGILYGRNRMVKATSAAFLTAISILLIVAVLIIVLMALGYNVNATIWLPISTTIFMVSSSFLLKENRSTDLSKLFSRDVYHILARVVVCDPKGSRPLQADLARYKRLLVNASLENTSKPDGKYDYIACSDQLEVSPSTVRRK